MLNRQQVKWLLTYIGFFALAVLISYGLCYYVLTDEQVSVIARMVL